MHGMNVKKKMETAGSANAPVTIIEATRCHNPQRHSPKYSPV